jgi:hypothetical protein
VARPTIEELHALVIRGTQLEEQNIDAPEAFVLANEFLDKLYEMFEGWTAVEMAIVISNLAVYAGTKPDNKEAFRRLEATAAEMVANKTYRRPPESAN